MSRLLGFFILLATATSVLAQPYFGVSLSAVAPSGTANGVQAVNSEMMQPLIGYRFSKTWEVEASYFNPGDVAFNHRPAAQPPGTPTTFSTPGSTASTIRQWTLEGGRIAVLGRIPLAPRWSAFGVGSIQVLNASLEEADLSQSSTIVGLRRHHDTQYAPGLGAGLSYEVEKQLRVRGSLEWIALDSSGYGSLNSDGPNLLRVFSLTGILTF